MSTERNREDIEKFKKYVIQEINEEIIESSQISPVFNILCHDPNEEKPVLALVPIPNDLFRDGPTKDALTNIVVPQILKKLEAEGVSPLCISMITEGWIWEGDPDNKMDIEEIKRTKERKEVVMITFETIEDSETRIFDKMGTKKNSKGEYIEGVYLKPREDTDGKTPTISRFDNLFKKAR